jgi:hypothetical protein
MHNGLQPNIYIYPQEEIQLFVTLYFQKGGKAVTSEYGAGWDFVLSEAQIDNLFKREGFFVTE